MKDNSVLLKNVGIWIRVSTEDQAKGESPEHHLQRGRLYAEFKGWKVQEVYDLAGISGKAVKEHPEGKRMLADIKRGHITGLIFSKLARLSRNKRELEDFAEYFRDCNADMISLQENIDTSTPAGRMFYSLIAAQAQWEREETVDRVQASIAIRAKLGSPLGGPAPFGYQWKDKKLVVDPKEAPVRKLMYEWFLQHKRKKTVVRLLNEAGYRTRNGSKFTSKTVTRLLQDPTAKGIQRSNHTTRNGQSKHWSMKPEKDWVIHNVDAIVSTELWDQCNAIIDQTYELNRRPAQKPVHIFAGIAVCECGEKMYVPSNSPKYVCRACRNKIPIADLDAIFTEEIKAFAYSSEQITAYLKSSDNEVVDKQQLLNVQQGELEKVRREIDQTYKLYQANQLDTEGFGKFYKPLDERQKQLEADIPRLEAEIDISKVNNLSAEQVALEAQDLSSHWPSLPVDDKRSIVEAITERITVGKGEITINLCCLPPSKDMAKGWRKGWFMPPFCRLVIKAILPIMTFSRVSLSSKFHIHAVERVGPTMTKIGRARIEGVVSARDGNPTRSSQRVGIAAFLTKGETGVLNENPQHGLGLTRTTLRGGRFGSSSRLELPSQRGSQTGKLRQHGKHGTSGALGAVELTSLAAL